MSAPDSRVTRAARDDAASDQRSLPTRLWYTRCPVPTVSGIAHHRRLLHDSFAEIGVELDSIRASSDPTVRASHFRHSLAGSFREGGNVPPIWTRSRGQDTAVVAITWVDERQLVLVAPNSPVSSPGDLAGARLALPRAGGDIVDVHRAESLRGLLTALGIAGIDREEVTWVDIDESAPDLGENPSGSRRHRVLRAVSAGAVDAVFVKGAAIGAALDAGLRPIIDLDDQTDRRLRISAGSPRPVTVDRATLERWPGVVERYLGVLVETAAWARTHPDEVVEAIAAETGAAPALVRRAFRPDLHTSFEPTLEPALVRALIDQKDFLLREGFLADDVDVEDWIDPGPLARLHAERVG